MAFTCWVYNKKEPGYIGWMYPGFLLKEHKKEHRLLSQSMFGGDWETRTLDLMRVKHAL